jgi:hypothetical protein
MSARTNYRSRIMNIRHGGEMPESHPARLIYKMGHRDARHEAAEIALEAENVIEGLYEALDSIVGEAAFDGLPETKQRAIESALATARGDQP